MAADEKPKDCSGSHRQRERERERLGREISNTKSQSFLMCITDCEIHNQKLQKMPQHVMRKLVRQAVTRQDR
jgi:ribonuclease HII